MEENIKKIIDYLPFNSYQDLFNAIRSRKANLKFNQSTCSQIASVRHPRFGSLGILLGFLLTTILLIIYSIYFEFYWNLLLIPLNLILTFFIAHLKKLKIIAWIVLIIDLFFIQLNSFFLILSLDIILLYACYNFWWNRVYKYAVLELEYNQEAFLWAWNRNGMSIEDSYGNIYFQYKLETEQRNTSEPIKNYPYNYDKNGNIQGTNKNEDIDGE